MPETRYIDIYNNQGDLISQKPYEVSDVQLLEEVEKANCEQYLDLSSVSISQPEIWYLLRAFGKKLGYTVE